MKFTQTYLLTLLVGLALTFAVEKTNAQAYEWVELPGSTTQENIEDIRTDDTGNSYVTGKFNNTLILGTDTLVSYGSADCFTAKYDPSGNVIWAVSEGGIYEDVGVEIDFDAAGNCYVGGRFIDTVNIGDTFYVSEGNVDIFVVKYDPSGNVVYVNTLGGNREDRCRGLKVDDAGYCYVSGRYRILGLFDTIFLPVVGIEDVFVAKLDLDGSVLWAKSYGGPKLDFGEAITLDKDDNIIITGSFFKNMTLGDTTLIALGDEEIFVAKLDNNGELLWAHREGGPEREYGEDVNTDEFGNIYISGAATGPIIFGEDTLAGYGMLDIFIFKYRPDGSRVWGLMGGSVTGNDGVWGSAYDGLGNNYLHGWFKGNFNIGPFFIPGTPSYNMVTIKVDAAGQPTWVKKAGDYNSDDIGRGVSTDILGNPYIAGAYQDTSIYDGITYVPVGKSDIFLARLDKGFENCAIADVTWAEPTGCNPVNGYYSVDVTVTHYFNPGTGSLRINEQFFPIGSSPQTVTMDTLLADGLPYILAVQFDDLTTCYAVIENAFIAPESCEACIIDTIYVDTIKTCKPISNRYQARITIEYSQEPDTGMLVVNGQYFNYNCSGTTVTLGGLYADGALVDIEAYFTEDTTCTYNAPDLFTAPLPCGSCDISGILVDTVTDCDPLTGTYDATVTIDIRAWPATGFLNVNGQLFTVTGTPMTVTLTDLVANGNDVDVSVNFTTDLGCTFTLVNAYTAPIACDTCLIAELNVLNVSACDPFTLTYDAELEVVYGNPPASGSLEINGVLFPITGSPQLITLTTLVADGLDVDLSASFTDLSACSYFEIAAFTAPATCLACNILDIAVDTLINNCDPLINTYDVQLTVTYLYEPSTGNLVVQGQNFAIGTSPQTVLLAGLATDTVLVDVIASFTDDPSCIYTEVGLYMSPLPCDTCPVPVNLIATLDSLAPTNVLVEWDAVTDANAYVVKGRKATSMASGEVNAFTNGKVVGGLASNKTYAWTVKSVCPYDTSEYAPENLFMTYDLRIADVSGHLADEITVYPNPTSEYARLIVNTKQDGEVRIQISNVNGSVSSLFTKQVSQGTNAIDLDVSTLTEGMYIINVSTELEQGMIRLMLSRD